MHLFREYDCICQRFLCYNDIYNQRKGGNMPQSTMSDQELSELIYQPYHTTRRQDSLRNGATLRYYLFKELGADKIKQGMKDVIDKYGFDVHKKEDFLQELQKALSEEPKFSNFVFSVSESEIAEKLLPLQGEYMARARKAGSIRRLPKGIDIYANSINDEHPCFFHIMHSRQSKESLKELLSAYKTVIPNGKYYLLSFEEKLPNAYNDLEVEIFLISKLLKIDKEKIIIVV